MTDKVQPIPEGSHGATPYLCCRDANAAIEFYKTAFGATETMRIAEPSGKIGHAEIKIGEALIMLADEYPDRGVRSPESLGGTPVRIHVYVEDVDAVFATAIKAGSATVVPKPSANAKSSSQNKLPLRAKAPAMAGAK